MNFMNAEVYGMMDQLGELMQAFKERERPLADDPFEAFVQKVAFVVQKIKEIFEIISEMAQLALITLRQLIELNNFLELDDLNRRDDLHSWLTPYVGKRVAWHLAIHWPRRWLPRRSFD